MIKTTLYGTSIFYQNDNTYMLPNVTGTVQWNGNSKKFQVSTGSGWQDIDNNVSFHIDGKFANIIAWAEKKIEEEAKLEKLAKNNVTIADLLKTLKETKEQIDIVKTLVENETS